MKSQNYCGIKCDLSVFNIDRITVTIVILGQYKKNEQIYRKTSHRNEKKIFKSYLYSI